MLNKPIMRIMVCNEPPGESAHQANIRNYEATSEARRAALHRETDHQEFPFFTIFYHFFPLPHTKYMKPTNLYA